jgi:hypothetical protein
MELCKRLDIEFDFDRLLAEALDLIDNLGWTNEQI